MRKVARQSAKIILIAGLAYFFPKLVLLYMACGIYDVSRNSARTAELFEKYFFGNGVLTWLLSPVNTVLDLLSLPYLNKGVYNLADLPPGHQAEIVKLIDSTRRQDLIGQLQQAAAAENRSMFFFKWFGANVDTIVRLPEFHADYKYVTTIGVSVFNKKQSTSKHFGPLRATLRVLYNIDDVVDDSAYIVVGDTTSYWRENKLFIFDDTLLHQSFNGSNRPRYCLFVDIVRPTLIPAAFKAFVWVVGKVMSQGSNKVFYSHWKVFKKPTAT
jgi:aspartyl/asparaginyl beta-hydroxylase